MNNSIEYALQTQLNQSLRFTSILGVNVAIHDEKHGFWSESAGFTDINATENIDINQSFYPKTPLLHNLILTHQLSLTEHSHP